MRAITERWLLKRWYSKHRPPWYLRALEPIYRTAYQRAQMKGRDKAIKYQPDVPLVVVGNITVGGSGKTPLVIRLCQLALEMKFKPGIASTGYGRQSRDTLLVKADSDTRQCGDEPVMLARRTGVPVVVAAKRIDAVKKLSKMGVDLVISDDGLQQSDLARDIEFCVVDGERGLGNGHLLPAGPLRESAERLGKVDFIISNGDWSSISNSFNISVMRLKSKVIHSLDESKTIPVSQFVQKYTGNNIHAYAGIGNPSRFFKMLEGLGMKFIRHDFPDHHVYVERDFVTIPDGSIVIMTEKDAVKCRALGLKNAWYIPVETRLTKAIEDAFKKRLAKLMKGNK